MFSTAAASHSSEDTSLELSVKSSTTSLAGRLTQLYESSAFSILQRNAYFDNFGFGLFGWTTPFTRRKVKLNEFMSNLSGTASTLLLLKTCFSIIAFEVSMGVAEFIKERSTARFKEQSS